MRIRIVEQPSRELLGEEIQSLLQGPVSRFWVASAWVRRPALRRLESDLRNFKQRVAAADSRALVGVDLGGTTREGLELAAELFGESRVFHSSGSPVRTFHPKLYLFEHDAGAVVFVGSANLTTGGLWGNFETGALIELDASLPDDAQVIDQVRDWYEQLWSDPDGARPNNGTTLAELEADPTISLPREGEVRQILAGSRPAGRTSARAFRPVKGLKPIPPAPPGDEAGDTNEQPPSVPVLGIPLEEIETPGNEDDLRVLVAGVPRDRWKQVGFNREVTEGFFRVYVNGDVLWIQGVAQAGALNPPKEAKLVFPSGSNQNHRIEFPEPDDRADPKPDRALLVVLERSFRTFRYMSLRPGDTGYTEMLAETVAREGLGTARKPETKRVLMTYAELKAAWPGPCPLGP